MDSGTVAGRTFCGQTWLFFPFWLEEPKLVSGLKKKKETKRIVQDVGMVHWSRFCLMTYTVYFLIWCIRYQVSRWRIDMCIPECHSMNSLEVMHFR